jgi:hypothetical protein
VRSCVVISMLKLSDAQVAEIRQLWLAGGIYQHELAARFGVSQALISHIVRGQLHVKPRGRNRPPGGRITEEGRECSRCQVFKSWAEFSPLRQSRLTGHQSACKSCRNVKTKEAVAKDPGAKRLAAWASYLVRKYGITAEQYAWLAERQGHKCALCLQPETQRRRVDRHGIVRVVDRLGVDHDHSCDRHGLTQACIWCIRGLLCDDCNRLLGFAEAKPLVAVRFADYLGMRPFLTEGGGARMQYSEAVGVNNA